MMLRTVRLIGIQSNLGMGVHFAKIGHELKNRGFNLSIIDISDVESVRQAQDQSQDADINVSFVAADIHRFFRGTNVQWVVFESTHVPEQIMKNLRPASQVWVPSGWGRQILLQNGLNDRAIRIAPEGVGPEFTPEYPNSDRFRFLFVGKLEQRKSLVETLTAWRSTFGNDSSVELIIKTQGIPQGNPEKVLADITALAQGLDNVQFILNNVCDMPALYRSCHVFVLPTKGEGWGLPLIEAVASGLPIITTQWGGQCEFLQHVKSSVRYVDFKLAPVECSEYCTLYAADAPDWGQWAQPSVEDLAQALVEVRTNYLHLKKQAVVNSDVIHQKFSWTSSADIVSSYLLAL
jgi:glycosyltransferase involved in cell wall biosynthesis